MPKLEFEIQFIFYIFKQCLSCFRNDPNSYVCPQRKSGENAWKSRASANRSCLQTSSSHPPVKLAEKAEQTFSPEISSLENQGFSIWLNIRWIRDSKQVKMSKQCYQSRLRWFGDSIGASIKVGKQKVFLGELYLESRAFETRVLRVTTNFLSSKSLRFLLTQTN